MRRVLAWLWDHKWVPFLVLGALVALLSSLVFRRGGGLQDVVGAELRAADAAGEARTTRIDLGEEQALREVRAKYAERRRNLDAGTEARVAKYENDPVALARAMERASRG